MTSEGWAQPTVPMTPSRETGNPTEQLTLMSNGAQEAGTKAPGDETSRCEASVTVEVATVRERVAPKHQVTRRHDVRQV